MENNNLFYGFRGSIIFPDQASIFNMDLENNSASKNKIFRDFFQMIEDNKKLESYYQSRVYYLIFRNKYNNILHCQLARRKQYSKRELIENNIIEKDDEDYPYVNILVNLKSQKFLIESNTQVFENYNTCRSVIENIINNNLKEKDIKIILEPIIENEQFWKYFGEDSEVYNIEFKLITPNIFNAENDAKKLLDDAHNNVGADIVNLKFCNSRGKLKPNRIGINSFVEYISNGGGDWKITHKDKHGNKKRVSSKQKSKKVNIPITYDDFKKDILTEIEIELIIKCFDSIEAIEELKEKI